MKCIKIRENILSLFRENYHILAIKYYISKFATNKAKLLYYIRLPKEYSTIIKTKWGVTKMKKQKKQKDPMAPNVKECLLWG